MKDYSVLLPCGESTMIVIHDAFDKGYKQGYKDGKADTPFTDTEEAEEKAYNRGLSDAWDAVRKIIEPADDGGYSFNALHTMFGKSSIRSILKHNTAIEAIAKIKAYEDKQKQDAEIFDVDHTCEEKQEQTRDEKMIDDIDFAIKATNSQDDYSMGMRNGMRYVKSLIDGKEPQYESRQTDEEIKLGIDLGDEVVDDLGAKGVVVGIDTYKGEVMLSLLMGNHKVPQLVKASGFKTKTSRHFPQIIEVLEQIKGEADGK